MDAISPAQIEGWMSEAELAWLAESASKCQVVIEIGSWKGRSTKALASRCPGVVYAVDHWMGSVNEREGPHLEAVKRGQEGMLDVFKRNLAPEIAAGKVIPIMAESEAGANKILSILDKGCADMVFIDGEHSYEGVRRDISIWKRLVRSGAMLCGHDYADPSEVKKAVDELVPGAKIGRDSIWFANVNHDNRVDVLVSGRSVLPWVKLQISQIRKFPPKNPIQYRLCDSGSTDGTMEWLLARNEAWIDFIISKTPRPHGNNLECLYRTSDAPIVAFLDVDAIPVKAGWLDDAVDILRSDEKVGAVGLSQGSNHGIHRTFIHPSFCVFRRKLYDSIRTSVVARHTPLGNLDTGEFMCREMEDAGYSLKFVASSAGGKDDSEKVVHFQAASFVMVSASSDDALIRKRAKDHKALFQKLGLWDEFKKYVEESLPLNPLCARYMEA